MTGGRKHRRRLRVRFSQGRSSICSADGAIELMASLLQWKGWTCDVAECATSLQCQNKRQIFQSNMITAFLCVGRAWRICQFAGANQVCTHIYKICNHIDSSPGKNQLAKKNKKTTPLRVLSYTSVHFTWVHSQSWKPIHLGVNANKTPPPKWEVCWNDVSTMMY